MSDLEPRTGSDPDKVALGEMAVKDDGVRFWLYAPFEPESNEIPHIRC